MKKAQELENELKRVFRSKWCPLFGRLPVFGVEEDLTKECHRLILACRGIWWNTNHHAPCESSYPDSEEIPDYDANLIQVAREIFESNAPISVIASKLQDIPLSAIAAIFSIKCAWHNLEDGLLEYWASFFESCCYQNSRGLNTSHIITHTPLQLRGVKMGRVVIEGKPSYELEPLIHARYYYEFAIATKHREGQSTKASKPRTKNGLRPEDRESRNQRIRAEFAASRLSLKRFADYHAEHRRYEKGGGAYLSAPAIRKIIGPEKHNRPLDT